MKSSSKHDGAVTVNCRIVLEYPDERTAGIVMRAIDQDNGTHARSTLDGASLVLEATARSESSMLHTLDDLLSCVKVAEEVAKGI